MCRYFLFLFFGLLLRSGLSRRSQNPRPSAPFYSHFTHRRIPTFSQLGHLPLAPEGQIRKVLANLETSTCCGYTPQDNRYMCLTEGNDGSYILAAP